MTGTDLIAVGEVSAPHGLRGEVRVVPLTDFPDRFSRTRRVIIPGPDGQRQLAIEGAREHKGFVLLKLEGIDTAELAETLRGELLYVGQDEVWPLPPDTWYLFQIVGLAVYDTTGRQLGTLREVLRTGANDVYVVTPEPGISRRDILIPAIRQVVREVDPDRGLITVEVMPGLIEDDNGDH